MNFIVKMNLSFILLVQLCFGEAQLAYQTEGFKRAAAFIKTQPT